MEQIRIVGLDIEHLIFRLAGKPGEPDNFTQRLVSRLSSECPQHQKQISGTVTGTSAIRPKRKWMVTSGKGVNTVPHRPSKLHRQGIRTTVSS